MMNAWHDIEDDVDDRQRREALDSLRAPAADAGAPAELGSPAGDVDALGDGAAAVATA